MKNRLLFTFLLSTFLAGAMIAQDFTIKGVKGAAVLTIKGKVSDQDSGQPLGGIIVQVKGAANGAVTDEEGNYEVKVEQNLFNLSEAPTLVFSQDGYEQLELAVQGRAKINAAMKADKLDAEAAEMIESGTAAGLTAKNICFSVGCVNEGFITDVPTPYLGSGFQGKVAGLQVNQVSGQPGQGPFFRIRSANSIANGQQPLIILDGVFLNGSTLADINPEDIDRIEVLKGSAGASLYGSQAANGVIQIFTRRGQELGIGDTRVVYRGEVGYSEEIARYNINRFTNREVLDPGGPQPVLGNTTAENIHDIPLPNFQDYQEDILFQRGSFLSNNLSVQGRTITSNFLFSAQRLRDEGVIQGNDGYTRNSFRANFDHRISQKFDLQLSSMYINSRQELIDPASNGPGSYLASALLLTPVFDLDVPNEEDGSDHDWDIDNTGFGTTNPLYDRANSMQTVERSRLLGNVTTNYRATDWLTLTYSAALDRSVNDFEHFINKGYLSTNIPGLFGDLASANVQNSNGGGIHRTNRINEYFISRFDATVRKKFTGFNTSLRASFLYEDHQQRFNEGIGEDLAVKETRSLDNAQQNVFIASEEQEITAYSGFLIGDVDYRNKYIFSGLFRREGSSLFGPEERWANYYRVSGAYRLTEDIRLKPFQELKLRASIGTAGIRPTFEQRFETFQLINGTVSKRTLGNRFLRPALSTETEVGINATFAKAFDLEVNYVKVVSEDQILLAPLTGAAGFVGQWKNAGTLEATVYEAALNTNFAKLFKVKNTDFKWDLLVTFDRIEQSITQLNVPAYNTGPGIEQSSLFLIDEGIPFGTMVGEVFATSLEQLEGQEAINPDDYAINPAGYVVHKDLLGGPQEVPYKLIDANGNPIVQPIGDINPDFRMGFANTIAYKGFRLFSLFDWKKGGDVYNMSKHWLYRDQRHGDVSSYPDVAASFFGNDGLYNGLVANNHFVEDGSFFMLREAALSYAFRKGLFGNFIETMQLSLIGRNLFTITDYSGFHPDVSASPSDENTLTNRVPGARGSDLMTPNGDPSLFFVDVFNYPLRRTFTFSVQLTF